MFRTLLRIVLLIIIVAAVAAFFFGYRMADRDDRETAYAVGTTGKAVDVWTRSRGGRRNRRESRGGRERGTANRIERRADRQDQVEDGAR